MSKRKLILGISIFVCGVLCVFSQFIWKDTKFWKFGIPIVCLGIFVIVYAFDWNTHRSNKNEKILVAVTVFETFFINGVNIFDFWGTHKCGRAEIIEHAFIDNMQQVKLSADKVKVTGKSQTFFVYIAEVSMAIYAVHVLRQDCQKLFSSKLQNRYVDEDAKQNYEYRCKIAAEYSKDYDVKKVEDCIEIIYSEDNKKRVCIIDRNDCFIVELEQIEILDEEEYRYGRIITLHPFWYWNRVSQFNTFVDTIDRARQIAQEYLK